MTQAPVSQERTEADPHEQAEEVEARKARHGRCSLGVNRCEPSIVVWLSRGGNSARMAASLAGSSELKIPRFNELEV